MSKALFERGMAWKEQTRQKIERRRKEIQEQEGRSGMHHGPATAAEHIDSYWEYRRLGG